MRAGDLPTIAEVVASVDGGEFEDYVWWVGRCGWGFPAARRQSLAFSDGRQILQARNLAQSAELFAAGWFLGAADKPGVRVYFPGTRLERLVDASEVFARPAE